MQIVCGRYICKNFHGLTIIIYPSADNGKQKKEKKQASVSIGNYSCFIAMDI